MKNDKTKFKSENTELYTITVELQAGRTARFQYSDLDIAKGHWDDLQARPVISNFGIKRIERSWRN